MKMADEAVAPLKPLLQYRNRDFDQFEIQRARKLFGTMIRSYRSRTFRAGH